MQITLYTSQTCHLCDEVSRLLERLAPQYDLEIKEVDISGDEALLEAIGGRVPTVEIEGDSLGRLEAPFDEAQLRVRLEIARRSLTPRLSDAQSRKGREPAVDSAVERFMSYISRHWLRFVSIALGIFVGLPWLAPVFAALGWWGIADPIYTVYAVT